MKAVYALAVLCAVILSAAAQQGCHLREMDLCWATSLVYLQKPQENFPTTDGQIDKLCETIKESHACSNNFTNKCATPLQKEVLKYVNEASRGHFNQFCTPGEEYREQFKKYAPCLKETVGSDDFRLCFNDVLATLDVVDEKHPKPFEIGCCGFRRFHKCTRAVVEGKCGQEAIQYAEGLYSQGPASIFARICSCSDDSSAECNELLPPSGTQPQGKKSSNPVARQIATLLGL